MVWVLCSHGRGHRFDASDCFAFSELPNDVGTQAASGNSPAGAPRGVRVRIRPPTPRNPQVKRLGVLFCPIGPWMVRVPVSEAIASDMALPFRSVGGIAGRGTAELIAYGFGAGPSGPSHASAALFWLGGAVWVV